jgi:acetyl esterase/lipase
VPWFEFIARIGALRFFTIGKSNSMMLSSRVRLCGRAIVLVLCALAAACPLISARADTPMTAAEYLALPHAVADKRIHYGPHESQFGDLWMPAGRGPAALVILIHGGCWRGAFDLQPVSSLASALRQAGLAVWSIEFRRVGEQGGGWPGTFHDVAAASDLVRALARDYPIDLRRVIAVGHSSGGHLAAWLAARPGLPMSSAVYVADPIPLKATVVLAGIPDMAAAVTGPLRRGDEDCLQANIAVMGGLPQEVPVHYQQGSPIQMLPTGVPQRNIVGPQDHPARLEQLSRFVQAAKDAGDSADLTVLRTAGHLDLVDPRAAEWAVIRRIILASAGHEDPRAD